MVVMKTILDSFSRCLGSHHNPNPNQDPNQSSPPVRHIHIRGNGNGNGSTDSREGERLGLKPEQTNSQTHAQTQTQTGACCEIPLHVDYRGTYSNSEQDREDGNFLAQARKKASAARRHRKLNTSDSSISRKASLEKARKKSNKRKLDIFRKPPERTSSFSKLLGSNSAIPQMLCFANPIFDSAEEERNFVREEDYTVDEETIASTLYFDARYEHVVERKRPVPLFREFRVPFSDTNDDILRIYNEGSHQSIKNVYCDPHQPPPPPNHHMNTNIYTNTIMNRGGDVNTSMMDDTSSSEGSGSVHQNSPSASFAERPQQLIEVAASPPFPIAAGCMEVRVPSPLPMSMCHKSRYELGVIESLDLFDADDMPPSLKLMSKSSNSTALTFVGSSKSNISLSPGHGVRYKDHPVDHDRNIGAEEGSRVEDWVRLRGNDEDFQR
jgi:hypothetical protein